MKPPVKVVKSPVKEVKPEANVVVCEPVALKKPEVASPFDEFMQKPYLDKFQHLKITNAAKPLNAAPSQPSNLEKKEEKKEYFTLMNN